MAVVTLYMSATGKRREKRVMFFSPLIFDPKIRIGMVRLSSVLERIDLFHRLQF